MQRGSFPFIRRRYVSAKGYEDVLCGSCSKDYGRNKQNCIKCASMARIILWIIGGCIWSLAAYWAAVSGVLSEIEGTSELIAALTRLNQLPRDLSYSLPPFDGEIFIESRSLVSSIEEPFNDASCSVSNNEPDLAISRKPASVSIYEQTEITEENELQEELMVESMEATGQMLMEKTSLSTAVIENAVSEAIDDRQMARLVSTSTVNEAHRDVSKRRLIETMKVRFFEIRCEQKCHSFS